MEKNNNNDLIYGKDRQERIVSIGVKDTSAKLFIEYPDRVEEKSIPVKHWILCNQKVDPSWIELNGNLHYKYAKIFNTIGSFIKFKQNNKHLDLYYINNDKEKLMVKEGYTFFKGMKHTEVSVLSFDIETTGIEHNDSAKLLIISNTFRKNGKLERKLFTYDNYSDEGEMIKDWCKWVQEKNPAIICGHNINMFDIPYLNFIAQKYNVTITLGRDNTPLFIEKYESKFRKDGSQFYHYNKVYIYGREVIDTLFLSLKYDIGRKYENYRLKNIIKQEGLEVKNRIFYDADTIRFNYKNQEEWKKIKAYAEFDADDSLALFDLMIPPMFYSAQIIPRPFQLITESATGGQINGIMLRSYLQQKHSVPKSSDVVPYEGAISIGNPGIYRNVFKVDVASLYPSIMIQYEVCDPEKDPNRYFLQLVKTLTEERLKNKKLAKETGDSYYTGLEQSQKVLINSAYGFLSAKGLNFNSPLKAAFITEKGREILNRAMTWAKNLNLKLVNADTDSISFSKIDESPFTSESRKTLLMLLNELFPNKIRWEDDGYYNCIIVLKAKNYIMQKEDGSLKYKGSAVKATVKELGLKEFIKDIIGSMFSGKQNYVEIYNTYVKEILNMTDINRWAKKATITSKTLNGTRTNETKVMEAIKETDYSEGDKIYIYYDKEDNLKLVANYNNDHNIPRLLKKLYTTSQSFVTIIPKDTFINYSLKNKKIQSLLQELK